MISLSDIPLEVDVCMLAEVLFLCLPNDVPDDVETS